MKNLKYIFLFILVLSQIICAKQPKTYLMNYGEKVRLKDINYLYKHNKVLEIEDFEDNDISNKPKWEFFGNINYEIKKNKSNIKWLGKHTLRVTGQGKSFYIAGTTIYLNKDISDYHTLKFTAKNNVKQTSMIQIELYDDDNNNKYIEVAKTNPDILTKDDKFVYKLDIQGKEWEVLYIPLNAFRDANMTVGDNVWNPQTTNNSGGLVQIQFLFISENKNAEIDMEIDNIKFLSQSKVRSL